MNLKNNPKAYKIMGCAMKVHDTLGSGFLESAYGDALEIEFKKADIPYKREDTIQIYYDDIPLKTMYRADFTCYDREYIIELKAMKTLTKIEWAQVIHYMRATKTRYALLINFGREKIQYETFDLDMLPSGAPVESSARGGLEETSSR